MKNIFYSKNTENENMHFIFQYFIYKYIIKLYSLAILMQIYLEWKIRRGLITTFIWIPVFIFCSVTLYQLLYSDNIVSRKSSLIYKQYNYVPAKFFHYLSSYMKPDTTSIIYLVSQTFHYRPIHFNDILLIYFLKETYRLKWYYAQFS